MSYIPEYPCSKPKPVRYNVIHNMLDTSLNFNQIQYKPKKEPDELWAVI